VRPAPRPGRPDRRTAELGAQLNTRAITHHK
jgi:hypothetical protein